MSTHKSHTMACLQLPSVIVSGNNTNVFFFFQCYSSIYQGTTELVQLFTGSLWSHGPCRIRASNLKDSMLPATSLCWILHKTIRRCSQPWMFAADMYTCAKDMIRLRSFFGFDTYVCCSCSFFMISAPLQCRYCIPRWPVKDGLNQFLKLRSMFDHISK